MRNEHGFSLVQLLVVVAIITVIAAVTAPRLLHASRYEAQSSAVTTMYAALTGEISRASTENVDRPFTPDAVTGLPAGCVVNAGDVSTPDGAVNAYEFTLQGGRGTPLVAAGKKATAPQPTVVAVTLTDADRSWATALVVNKYGVVTRYDWRDNRWNRE